MTAFGSDDRVKIDGRSPHNGAAGTTVAQSATGKTAHFVRSEEGRVNDRWTRDDRLELGSWQAGRLAGWQAERLAGVPAGRSKLITETFALVVVIGDGLGKFTFGRREKDNFHYYLAFSISANRSFAGIAAISPRSNASIRSSASWAHNASIVFLD